MLKRMIPHGRKALLFGALALFGSVQTAAAEGLSWWCYNGSCCKMEGGAVTSECNHSCILSDGQHLAPSVLMGCEGYAT